MKNNKKICFFASYYTSKQIPYYVKVYLLELRKHVSRLLFVTSQIELDPSDIQFCETNHIECIHEDNSGYDFGKWYKALKKTDVSEYDQVFLVNDSCVLFKSIDEFMSWADKTDTDEFIGMTFSEAVSIHIQSYFIVLNKKAIQPTLAYFDKMGVINNIQEVIRSYEIGLSTYLISKGLKLKSFVDNAGYQGEFSPYYYCINYHLKAGLPLIKKKILFCSYRKDELGTLARMNFNINRSFYYNLIKKYCKQPIIDLQLADNDKAESLTKMAVFKFNIMALIIKLFRPLYKLLKRG